MKKIKVLLIVFLLLIGCSQNGNEVNIYTSRHYDSDDELYALFTEKTGIQVNVISGKGAALIERIKAEGENSPADIYFTVDAGNLWKVQSEGFFQSISSNKINSIVPENLRGPNNEWIAIAKRARVIFYNPKKISKDEIKNLSYEDLSNPKWKGRIVIRSSNNMYNQSLVASLISNNGIENTEIWGNGLISNFARKPQGNDRSQIMAVANEEADLAIANSYYIGLMLSGTKGSEQLEAAKKVNIHFPNQNNRGAHINISGAGILKSSPNSKNAIKFLEFLLSEEMQKNIVNNSYEYPILENIDPHPLIKNFGIDFKEDRTSVSDYGELNPEAIKLMDRVGWK